MTPEIHASKVSWVSTQKQNKQTNQSINQMIYMEEKLDRPRTFSITGTCTDPGVSSLHTPENEVRANDYPLTC